MEKAGITTGKFIAGIVIAILASSAISAAISTQLLIAGPQGPQGATGPAGPAGPQGPSGGLYAPNYDSGWVDISNKAGKYFNITHNLNSADVIVDIRGRTTAGDGANQRYLGLTGNIPGWTKIYGGTGDDYANSVVQTGDGGYALAGGTWSYGAGVEDFWLVKTDFAGNQLWNKTYGGAGYDECFSMVQTLDGGYALAGDTDPLGSGRGDFWLVKTDSAGNMQWNKTYGGTSGDEVSSVIQTLDGGYALVGNTASYGAGLYDAYLVKTDASGNMQWNKTYGGTNLDYANSVVQTLDEGYALAGGTRSSGVGDVDFWLVKTDFAGNQLWNKTYGGAGYDECLSMVQTLDGGYALAGDTDSFGAGLIDFWLVKTDSAGAAQWNKTYGGTGYDGIYSLLQTPDEGYALAGDTDSFGAGGSDFWLVKTDSAGSQQWIRIYGGTGDDYANSVVQTGDGGFALAGYTDSFGAGNGDFWLAKTDVESGLAWTDSTANTITLYRGATDIYWNYVRVRIWKID